MLQYLKICFQALVITPLKVKDTLGKYETIEYVCLSVCLSVELHFLRNNESFFEYYEMIKYG